MSESRPDADLMARTARTMSIITAVLTALVAFNTLVYSCANDRDTREKAALERLSAEERFWTDAMKELSELVGKKAEGTDVTVTWENQCALLGDRTSKQVAAGNYPTTDDIAIADEFERVKAERSRVTLLRSAFQLRMLDKGMLSEKCASRFAGTTQIAEQASSNPPPQSADILAYKKSDEVEAAIAKRLPSIVLTPISDNGWDIDVFWCERSDKTSGEANFNRALREGEALASLVQGSSRVAGQQLGRIRVRKLSWAAQSLTGSVVYYNKGNRVLYDQNNVLEENMATEIATTRNGENTATNARGGALGPLEKTPQVRPSQWYLSLFICGSGSPPSKGVSQS
jgi:hypothetical protein